ncbi:MAG: glycosyltransferase, partial [Thermodesulfobacteriota bacterium]
MKCDITIPVWNQLEYTKRCLESIRRHTDFPHRVIVIDNGSDQETKDHLNLIKRDDSQLLVITNQTNRGYVKAVNQGLAASSHEFICLLNNDTVVTQGWLSRITSLAGSNERIGIINPLGNVGKK